VRSHDGREEGLVSNTQQFGVWVRQAREDLGWTHDDLASGTGLSISTVQEIETGSIAHPDAEMQGAITHCLELGRREQQVLERGRQVVRTQYMVRGYPSARGFKRDAALLVREGWTITEVHQRAGWGRLLLWRPFVRHPSEPRLVVTFQCSQTINPPPPGQRTIAPPPLPWDSD
jgi:transcriptional regulator with XRE-family HTH domain